MKYTLYIAENCHQCEEVILGLKELQIELELVNVDLEDRKAPIEVFAFPALFKGEILKRYGSDILTYFKENRA